MDGGPREKAKTATLKQQVADAVRKSRRRTRARRKGQDVCSVVEPLQSEPAPVLQFQDHGNFDLQDNAYDVGSEEHGLFPQVNATAGFMYPITDIGAISYLTTGSRNTSRNPCGSTEFEISDNTASYPSNVRGYDQFPTGGAINFNANDSIWNNGSDRNVANNLSLSSSEMSHSVSLPDTVLLLHYIEEIYPWQFRHYAKPPFSKAWLLWKVLQSRPLFLAVLAVSSSHMNLRHPPDNPASAQIEERTMCDKYDLAAQELRHYMEQHEHTVNGPESLTVLLSIVILMFFNVSSCMS